MALYDPVNGVYRKVSKKYDPVNGVYRKVKAAYDPVDGVYRKYFSGGIPASELAVGDSVWLNVDGVLTESLVVHQGNPDSTIYDASCDGTWVLMKDIYTLMQHHASYLSIYSNSTIHKYLNETFFGLLGSTVQSAIKQVKIPYRVGGTNGSTAYGADGLDAKGFLLSGYEAGLSDAYLSFNEGACLDYFRGIANTKRVAYYNGEATHWWLRSMVTLYSNRFYAVTNLGRIEQKNCTENLGIRPAFILDSNTPVNQSNGINIIA